MILKGDTVRFECEFRWFDGNPIEFEADKVTFKIFDKDRIELENFTLSIANRLDSNHYYYDFTIPDAYDGLYYYEFKGFYRNNPFIARDDFSVSFDD